MKQWEEEEWRKAEEIARRRGGDLEGNRTAGLGGKSSAEGSRGKREVGGGGDGAEPASGWQFKGDRSMLALPDTEYQVHLEPVGSKFL